MKSSNSGGAGILAMTATQQRIKVGDRLELDVYALAYGGEGIAKHEGLVVFVPEALPGDKVLVTILQIKKRFARGELLEIITPSGKRTGPFCSKAGTCGGCTWQHFNYPEQLKAKQAFVENALQHVGHLKGVHVLPVIKAAPIQGYRHKIQIPFQQLDGHLAAGFYTKKTHQVIPIEECPVQPGLGNKIFKAFLALARQYGYTGYNETTHSGQLRHLVIRINKQVKEASVVVVTQERELPRLQELAQTLHQSIPEISGVIQNVNQAQTNVILGPYYKTLVGRPYLYEEIRGLKYRISVESFFQVNPHQLDHLAQVVLGYTALNGHEKVVDLYCGVGFFTLEAARKARMVYGIENVASAIEDAQANKHLNQFANVEFKCQDATEGVEALITKGFVPDVLILDPPRRGCDSQLLKKMMDWKTKRLVYISCNPVSLARDLALLTNGGYRVQQVQPLDLFPHTYHIESVASLVRNK